MALGEVIELAYGKALKEADRDGGAVPVVGSSGILGGHSSGITDGETIVIGRKGSIGSVTWINGPAWPIDTAYYVKPRYSDLDNRWLYWLLKFLPLSEMNKSAAVPGLNREDVYRLDVHLPNPSQQRRVAAILDAADEMRAKHREALVELHALPTAIFRESFGGALADAPRRPLGEMAELVTKGTTPTSVGLNFSSEGVPFLRAQNLRDGTVDLMDSLFIDVDAHDTLRRSWVHPGDLLLTIAGTIGRTALVPADADVMNCNQAVAIIRLKEPHMGRWLRAWFASRDARSQIASSSVTGTIANLSLSQIKALQVPLLDRRSIEGFAEQEVASRQFRARVDKSLSTVEQLMKALQAHAFRGEL